MRLKKSEYYGVALNVLLTGVYVWYLFRTLLRAPGHAFLSNGGDGSKNYYTYLYHVLFGKGFHFEGMNYPWGEHISFTDNQPLLSYPLSYLQSLFHFSINDLLLIMNLLIAFSFVVTSLILCRFFIRMGANPFVSAVFGLLITFLAPNFYRVFGHFGLCYTFNIVLTLYWLFQYSSTSKKQYLIALFLLSFFVAFIHMYNLLLSMVIIFFFAMGSLVLEKEKIKQKLLKALPLIFVVIFSFVAVKLVFFLTDPVKDRPVSPWGILYYVSTLKQFFTTEYSDLGRTFSLLFNRYISRDLDEGYAYAGIIPLCYILFVSANAIFYFIRNTEIKLFRPISKPEKYLLIISLFSFLMAIGFPFTYGMSFLLDLMPSIKQFRSLGRISVITYFSLSMACVLRISMIFNEWRTRKHSVPAFYFLLTVIFLWSIEIFSYSKYIQHRADEVQKNYKGFFFLADASEPVKVAMDTQYQCILGIPLFCIGSEKVGKEVDSEFSGELFELSLRSGLPIVNTLMSRSSWKQSFQLMRLAGGDFSDKEYFTKSINDKKILLLRLKEAYMTEDERSLLALCDSTGEEGRVVYYSLDWQRLMQFQTRKIDSLNRIAISHFPQTNGNIYANHFDNHRAAEVLFGTGALDVSGTDSVLLMDAVLNARADSVFEFSLWTRVVGDDYKMPSCSVTMYDSVGAEISSRLVHAQNAVDNHGLWFRISTELKPGPRAMKVKIIFLNGDEHAALYIDEFLLKPLHVLQVNEDPEKKHRMYNNHLITLKSQESR